MVTDWCGLLALLLPRPIPMDAVSECVTPRLNPETWGFEMVIFVTGPSG